MCNISQCTTAESRQFQNQEATILYWSKKISTHALCRTDFFP
jgi:hypothetical protein